MFILSSKTLVLYSKHFIVSKIERIIEYYSFVKRFLCFCLIERTSASPVHHCYWTEHWVQTIHSLFWMAIEFFSFRFLQSLFALILSLSISVELFVCVSYVLAINKTTEQYINGL